MCEDAGCEPISKMCGQPEQCPSLHKMSQAEQTVCKEKRPDPDKFRAEQKMQKVEQMIKSRDEPCAGQPRCSDKVQGPS
jgi:hypothetical protein